jgi:hypothetical protein
LASSALASLICWDVLACTALSNLGALAPPRSLSDWAMCVAASSFWSGSVIIFALPFYALLLTWYVMRFGDERLERRSIVLRVALLGIPPGLALLYGNAWPPYGGLLAELETALPIAGIGWAAASLGLLLPRLLISQLAPGQLVRRGAPRTPSSPSLASS